MAGHVLPARHDPLMRNLDPSQTADYNTTWGRDQRDRTEL
jgi:hypothetical protein